MLPTRNGQLVIRSEVDDVQIRVTQNGQEVDRFQISTDGRTTTLRAGQYEIELTGPGIDGLQLDKQRVTLSRGKEQVVVISREEPRATVASRDGPLVPPGATAGLPSSAGPNEAAPARLVQTGEFYANIAHVRFSRDGRSMIGLMWGNDVRPEVRDLTTGKTATADGQRLGLTGKRGIRNSTGHLTC